MAILKLILSLCIHKTSRGSIRPTMVWTIVLMSSGGHAVQHRQIQAGPTHPPRCKNISIMKASWNAFRLSDPFLHGASEFHDDGSDFLLDNRSYVSDVQEEFDIENFLNFSSDVVQSPDTVSTDYLSGPDLLPSQSLQYASPYSSGQVSPTFGLGFPNSFQNTGDRSSGDFLSPPMMNRGGRSHSQESGGHRSTISEGSSAFKAVAGDDIRGRGIARAKSVPSSQATFRGKSPYDRPASQTEITRLEIPISSGSFSGQSSPELESPSPSSAKDVVATDAVIQASIKRRKRVANFFCSLCNASFTTENSKRRMFQSFFNLIN